jgi:hypothetical protein
MPNHYIALKALHEAGHRDAVEYFQTLEAHNQLLQEELERVLKLLSENTAMQKPADFSDIAERAEAVLIYTREYSNTDPKKNAF